MADLPSITGSAADEIARLERIHAAVVRWVGSLLTMPQRDGVRRETEGTAPGVGAVEIAGVQHAAIGSQMGHDGIRERSVILTYYVVVRRNGIVSGDDARRLAYAAGVYAALCVDASAPADLVAERARLLPVELSTWTADAGAQQRSIEGAFTVRVQTAIRVLE